MANQRIRSASKALEELFKIMPDDILVNIIGFGSSYQSLFPESRPCDSVRKQCIEHCQSVQADLGGTEILQPLQFVYRQSSSRARQILLITGMKFFFSFNYF